MDISKEDQKAALLAKAAKLYYIEGKNQQTIAKELNIARPVVSRMLNEARAKQIVSISVAYPWKSRILEKELLNRFSLRDAQILIPTASELTGRLQELGIVAADYLLSIIEKDSTIGISWGKSLREMINNIKDTDLPHVKVVQLIGASGTEVVSSDGPRFAQMLSEKFNCQSYYLHAPLVVETEMVRDALLQDPGIKKALHMGASADIALVGIGCTVENNYSLLRTGYIDSEQLKDLADKGAIGDICARHFDINGHAIDTSLSRRTIGIQIDQLKNIKTVIGVSGDKAKSKAIYAALKGKFLDVFITDAETALEVIRMHDAEQ